MQIEQTTLQYEINKILSSSEKSVHSTWELTIETLDNKNIKPLKLISVTIDRDYLVNYGDVIFTEFTIGLGTFIYDILPYKESLRATLKYQILGERTDTTTFDNYVKSYKGILLYEGNELLKSSNVTQLAKSTADLMDIVTVNMQLLDPALEKMRLIETGGIYREVIPGDVIKTLISWTSQRLNLPKEDSILGVDVVDYDNNNVRKNVVIPHGTRIFDVANTIQKDNGGVYNTGIGSYLQDGIWYIWPEYNTRRFDVEAKNLTIINIPANKYRGVERTYRYDPETFSTLILSTGETDHLDASNYEQLNSGNVVRYTRGESILSNFGTVNKNKYEITRKLNNSEEMGIVREGNDFAPVSKRRITYNPFLEASDIAKRNGSFLSLVWENSKPSLIYPGMPVKVMFLKNVNVYEVYGVIVKVNHYIQDTKKGPLQGRCISNSALGIFIERFNT